MSVIAWALYPPVVQIIGKGKGARWFHEPPTGAEDCAPPAGWSRAEVPLGQKQVRGWTAERLPILPLAWRGRWVDDDGRAHPWDLRPAGKSVSRVHVLAWAAQWGPVMVSARGTITGGLVSSVEQAARETYTTGKLVAAVCTLREKPAQGQETPTEVVAQLRPIAEPEGLSAWLKAHGGMEAVAGWERGWVSG